MNTLPINLTTLTPLWTGGTEKKADRLHITGIMGSLRWVYEVLVRGVGGDACDPTQQTCIYDSDDKLRKGLCDVCRIFGATGYARRFRLIVANDTQLRVGRQLQQSAPVLSRKYIARSGRQITPTWFFGSEPLTGYVELKIIGLYPDFQPEVIGGLFQFLSDWTSVGAKPQMGFGIVKLTPPQDTHYLLDHLQLLAGTQKNQSLPSLQNMFFTSIQVATRNDVETFTLKYDLRTILRSTFPTSTLLRHFVMGTVQNERQGAKIMMSRPYGDNIIRIWGWIPEDIIKFGISRQDVIKSLHSHLNKAYPRSINYWREFDSTRDTKHRYDNSVDFLKSLMEK